VVETAKEEARYVDRIKTHLQTQLSARTAHINDCLQSFVRTQAECVSVLAKRVKLSDSKVAHLQNELSAYRQLSLQHMIAETELRCVRMFVCACIRSNEYICVKLQRLEINAICSRSKPVVITARSGAGRG
jgi:hypothetical protein